MFKDVEEAFSRQSKIFDEYEHSNAILQWMRSAIREHILMHLNNGDKILELNAGTGLDAVFLANAGYRVHAIDISYGMLDKLNQKVETMGLDKLITSEKLSFTELNKVKGVPFDFIFSNFGGLNCTNDLKKITKHFDKVLKPGGKISLVIMPPISPWEIVLLFKGKFEFAFRRLRKQGTLANIEGVNLITYYYSLRKLKADLGTKFRLIDAQGLASLSPPPYATNFIIKHPMIYRSLKTLDKYLSHFFPFNRAADHLIATFIFDP